MDITENNPLRAPWKCDIGVITDCDGKVVAVLTQRSAADVRGRAVCEAPRLAQALRATVEWHGRRASDKDALLPWQQQKPEIASAMRALDALEVPL